jgi:hypothetical protein
MNHDREPETREVPIQEIFRKAPAVKTKCYKRLKKGKKEADKRR